MLCAACKREITDTAKFCQHCGATVASSTASPATKKCPQCGAENATTAKFCRVDGFRFDGAQPTATTAQAHLETAPAAAASATQLPPSGLHPARPAEEQAAGSVVCPQCGTVNRPGATFCKTDGFRLADSTSVASKLALGSVACPTCGTENVPGAKFCRKDGTPLAGPAETPPPTRPSSPQPVLRVGAGSTATSRAPIRLADPAQVAPRKWLVPVLAVILITLAGGGGFLYWTGAFSDRHLAIQEALNARLQAQGLAGVKAMVRKDFTADVTGTVSTSDQKQKALAVVREEKSLTQVVENINVPPTVGEAANKPPEEERRVAEEARPASQEASALAGEFVAIPGGTFQMGCSPGDSECKDNERPVHTVSIKPFRMGKYEVTVGHFRRFVEAAGYRTDAERGGSCWAPRADGYWVRQAKDWHNPGFAQTERNPVICVSWNDAKAYVQWLSQRGVGRYRLPSESEWEYAARAGGSGRYSFGDSEGMLCQYGNIADRTAKPQFSSWDWAASCDDGALYAAPVGGYRPNGFGLHDMHGNVEELTEDCYHDSYAGAPSDGAAWTAGDCEFSSATPWSAASRARVGRGSSWGSAPARSSSRPSRYAADNRYASLGFRIIQDQPTAATATSPVPAPFAPISGSKPTEALPTPPTEVADMPDVRVGDTYLVDSQYPNNAKLNNTTERKVVSVIDGGVTVASRNVKSRSGQSRMLRYTKEWNLVSSRNADGSEAGLLASAKIL